MPAAPSPRILSIAALCILQSQACTRPQPSPAAPQVTPVSTAPEAAPSAAPSPAPAPGEEARRSARERLEATHEGVGGRLGVMVADTGTGIELAYHADERFPMCSTFKLLLAAAVLTRVERGEEKLDRVLRWRKKDLLAHSPITEQHVATGLTVEALCAAAVSVSDNTAANSLLDTLGGPAGLTGYIRGWGDAETRLDRNEPTLNSALPDDPRDTTTPAAMLRTVRSLLLGSALSEDSRQRLLSWLRESTTGTTKVRAGLPSDWSAGDKTGMCANGATNDVAVLWPPDGKPILVAAYSVDSPASEEERNGVLAAVGRVVVGMREGSGN
ncbi:MAG: class A beta-lactamase [Myxococcales bacterium]